MPVELAALDSSRRATRVCAPRPRIMAVPKPKRCWLPPVAELLNGSVAGPFGFGSPPSRRDGRAISCLNAERRPHAIRRITTRTPTEAVDLFSIGRKH